jgi:VWFA-related protein
MMPYPRQEGPMSSFRLAGPILLLWLSFYPASFAENPASPTEKSTAPGAQRERVNLILINVVVTDRKGRPVDDLRPDEFRLRVDGKPHAINSIELHWTAPQPAPGTAPQPSPVEGRPGSLVPAFATPSSRTFVFLLDGLNRERGLGPRPIEAVREFLRKRLLPGDEVMIAGLGRQLKVYQELTSDASLTLKAMDAIEADPAIRNAGEDRSLENLRTLEEQGAQLNPRGIEPDDVRRLAQQYADEDRRRALRTIAALRAIVASLHSEPGRKDLFFLTDGFPTDADALYGAPGNYNTRDVNGTSIPASSSLDSDILKLAREAGTDQVAINTVNTQGMTRGFSLASRGPHKISAAQQNASGRSPEELVESSASETLASFALGTGGLAYRGNNDFLPALERVERETQAGYVVSYVPAGGPDGRLHAVRVDVTRKGARIRAKEGLIYMTEEQVQERQLFSAFMSPELYHDFPVSMEALAYFTRDGVPATEFAIGVPNRMLLFLPDGRSFLARLEAGLTLQQGKSRIADQFNRKVEVRLEPGEWASHEQLSLVAKRDVPPGDYEAVVVVRDLGTDNVGALRMPVRVPSLSRNRIAMSSLILSDPDKRARRVDLEPETVGDASLVVPSADRIFRRDSQIAASCTVYHPMREPTTREAAFQVKGLLRKGAVTLKQFSSTAHRFTADQAADSIPVSLPVSLADFEPGIYTLEVQVLDTVGKNGIAQSVDFMVR